MVVKDPDRLIVPKLSWSVIRSRITRFWDPRDAPHHSIIGQTRSGKSYLMTRGILPTKAWERVLIIDGKGDDKTLSGVARPVTRFPGRLARSRRQLLRDNEKYGNWFRLVTSSDWDVAKEQAREALERVMSEGDWYVVIDELRYLLDKSEAGLGLVAQWEAIVLRGGSRGVGLVSLTQEPRWVRGSFYTQSSFYWFSKVEDEAAQKRISEIGSSRALLPLLTSIPRRWFLYMDNLEDERFWALTRVTD